MISVCWFWTSGLHAVNVSFLCSAWFTSSAVFIESLRHWSPCASASYVVRCSLWHRDWWSLWHSCQETSPSLHLAFSPHSTILGEADGLVNFKAYMPLYRRKTVLCLMVWKSHEEGLTVFFLQNDDELGPFQTQFIWFLWHVGFGGLILW